MSRPPLARQKVLEAARRIIAQRGAGHLTFDNLALESGITRGGITYHFPTKDELLRALIAADLADSIASAERLAAELDLDCPRTRQLLALVRSSDAGCKLAERRYVAGMLSAIMHDPTLLEPVRSHLAREFAGWCWDETDLDRYLLLLAADGLFWTRLFSISPLPDALCPKITQRIEQRLRALASPDGDRNPANPPAPGPPMDARCDD